MLIRLVADDWRRHYPADMCSDCSEERKSMVVVRIDVNVESMAACTWCKELLWAKRRKWEASEAGRRQHLAQSTKDYLYVQCSEGNRHRPPRVLYMLSKRAYEVSGTTIAPTKTSTRMLVVRNRICAAS
jgi:hypothetical protein